MKELSILFGMVIAALALQQISAQAQSFQQCTEHLNLTQPERRDKAPADIIRDCSDYLYYMNSRDPAFGPMQQNSRNIFLKDAYFERAKAYARSGDMVRALPDLDRAIKAGKKTAWSYFMRGQVRETFGKTDLAVEDFRQVLTFPQSDFAAEPIAGAREALIRLTGKATPAAPPEAATPPIATEKPAPPPLRAEEIDFMTRFFVLAREDMKERLIPDMNGIINGRARKVDAVRQVAKAQAYIDKVNSNLQEYTSNVPDHQKRLPTDFMTICRTAMEVTRAAGRKHGMRIHF